MGISVRVQKGPPAKPAVLLVRCAPNTRRRTFPVHGFMQLQFPRILTIVMLLLLAPIGEARDALTLPPTVSRIMEKRGVPADALSVWIEEVDSDQVMLQLNADHPRTPASTIKVLTTFAALDTLGPAFTWRTRAYMSGSLRNGTLDGDLILVGGGDPFLTAERWWSFVAGLRRTGLKRIAGDVVIDSGLFATLAEDRAAFDGQPYRTYNVAPDALVVNFQTSQFVIAADPDARRVSVAVDPMPANLEVVNDLRLGSGRCSGYNRGVSFTSPDGVGGPTIRLTGTYPAACGRFIINRAIMDAPSYAYGTFRTLWEQSGGSITGGMRQGARPEAARLLYVEESLTLAEIIRLVNKYSSNVMARTLLLTLGLENGGPPATEDKGRQAIMAWLTRRGIDVPQLNLANGSGLSRAETISAEGMGNVLHAAWHSQYMPEFAASLPLSATDGTLRNRFRAAGMQGRLRMKTGRIDDVSGLAGFVTAASGRHYIVVVLINYPGVHRGPGEEIQNALLRWVFGQ
jgi:serine-type D-Ala-D-Ala carboxypeptidase/endopeptidase (penicillin-binding protein 4)